MVTAQRFSETAQRTALALTVIDEQKLVGLTDVRNLTAVTPGLQLGTAGNVVQTFIRGVGSVTGTTAEESAIAYNADGVFLFTPSMVSPLMYDLERIEALKGPQGTLYGRNASGGAINILTRGARLNEFNGYVEGEAGNYQLMRLTGAVNVPVGETLGVRLAAQHVEHDGYLSDGTEDQNVTSGRIRVLWEPSADVSLRLGADISDTDSIGGGTSLNPNPTGDDFIGQRDPRLVGTPAALLSSPPNPPPFYKNQQWSVFGQLDVNLGFATLTVLPAYRNEDFDSRGYPPGYEVKEKATTEQSSIEARLANRTDSLKWVVGAYYFTADQKAELLIRNESNFQNAFANNPREIESYAFFGEATFNVTETLRLTGGLRYTNEETKSRGFNNEAIGSPFTFNPVTGAPNVQTLAFNPFDAITNPTGELLDAYINNGSKSDAVTWKIGVEYDLTPDSLLFATVSKGFKGGGTYVDPRSDGSFRPEYLTAYELGSRNRFLDNTLQINGELFYWELKDQQISYPGFNDVGQVVFKKVNAGAGTMYGANVDVIWKATSADTFSLNVEYLKAEYDSFTRTVPSATVLTATRCDVRGYAGPFSLAPTVIDCSGQPMLRSPKWSGSAAYDRRFELGDGGAINVNLNTTFSTSRYLGINYTPFQRQKATALFNASLGYTSPDNGYSVTAWIKNIADERVMTFSDQLVSNYARPGLAPPRTYGVTARYGF